VLEAIWLKQALLAAPASHIASNTNNLVKIKNPPPIKVRANFLCVLVFKVR
jgi:hypothetical protein